MSYDEAQTIAQLSVIAATIPSMTPSKKPAAGGASPRPSSDPGRTWKLQPGELDSVSRELAAFIGPIAKVVVKRAADRCASVDELYALVAGEIDTEKDRVRFLAGKKRSTL
jgi:serine/threonine-protein kinase